MYSVTRSNTFLKTTNILKNRHSDSFFFISALFFEKRKHRGWGDSSYLSKRRQWNPSMITTKSFSQRNDLLEFTRQADSRRCRSIWCHELCSNKSRPVIKWKSLLTKVLQHNDDGRWTRSLFIFFLVPFSFLYLDEKTAITRFL